MFIYKCTNVIYMLLLIITPTIGFEQLNCGTTSSSLLQFDKIHGVKHEVLEAGDQGPTLLATIQLHDHCDTISVTFKNYQQSWPQMPSIYTIHPHQYQPFGSSNDSSTNNESHEMLQVRPFKSFREFPKESSFLQCLSHAHDADYPLIIKEMQSPSIWMNILENQLVYTTDVSSVVNSQRHFPEDVKTHIDSKRWIHLLSLLVLVKDIMEHIEL